MMLKGADLVACLNHLTEAQPTTSFKLLNAIFLQNTSNNSIGVSQSSSNNPPPPFHQAAELTGHE